MMKIVTIINKSFLRLIEHFKRSYRRPILYKISSIDAENQTAILHVNFKNIFFTQTFSEIISNVEIIEGLSPQQACWLGVYYGRALKTALDGKKNLRNIKKPDYLLQHKQGCYKIISENRDGNITCIHVKTKQTLTSHPLCIAEDGTFIKNFDANQACYIGILAGIAMIKKQNHAQVETKQHCVPYLRLVK